MDRAQLADFLRRRREAMQPEDVGLPRGPRRRTGGLRREEVAALASMSTNYLTRLEQQRGPQPSEAMLAAIARGLRLTVDERDHLFRLAGRTAPSRAVRTRHVAPALLRVLDQLDTAAQVVSDLGETLAQNELAMALVGDHTGHRGLQRFVAFRWFSDPSSRATYPAEDHPEHARLYVAGLRAALARQPDDPEARELVEALTAASAEFVEHWSAHEILTRSAERKRMVTPVGVIEVHCQILVAENEAQRLLVYTTTPGTEDAERLRLLSVVGNQAFSAAQRS